MNFNYRPTERTDLVKPLTEYFNERYGKVPKDALVTLQESRNASSITRNLLGKDEIPINFIRNAQIYLQRIDELVTVVPDNTINFKFVYYVNGLPRKSHLFSKEKKHMTYNLALAILNQGQKDFEKKNFKQAFYSYEKAVFLFQRIEKSLEANVSMVKVQECLYFQKESDKTTHAHLLARIALGVSQYYGLLEEDSGYKGEKKRIYYEDKSFYHLYESLPQDLPNDKKVPLQIAYLKKIKAMKVDDILDSLIQENNLIYRAPIPEPEKIKPISLVEPVPLDLIHLEPLFNNLSINNLPIKRVSSPESMKATVSFRENGNGKYEEKTLSDDDSEDEIETYILSLKKRIDQFKKDLIHSQRIAQGNSEFAPYLLEFNKAFQDLEDSFHEKGRSLETLADSEGNISLEQVKSHFREVKESFEEGQSSFQDFRSHLIA